MKFFEYHRSTVKYIVRRPQHQKCPENNLICRLKKSYKRNEKKYTKKLDNFYKEPKNLFHKKDIYLRVLRTVLTLIDDVPLEMAQTISCGIYCKNFSDIRCLAVWTWSDPKNFGVLVVFSLTIWIITSEARNQSTIEVEFAARALERTDVVIKVNCRYKSLKNKRSFLSV